jgi:chromosome segregation ATPase
MFRFQKLIFVSILTGCATTAGENSKLPSFLEEETIENIVVEDDCFLESIDATLELADNALISIREEEKKEQQRLSYLQKTIRDEELLITTLESQLATRDSIIEEQNQEIKSLSKDLVLSQEKTENIEDILQRHIQEYSTLLEKIEYLESNLQESYTQIEYLDSLILTNKKLTKIYATD